MLEKGKLNNIEVLISKSLINSNVTLDEFISINNVLTGYDVIKNLKTSLVNQKL